MCPLLSNLKVKWPLDVSLVTVLTWLPRQAEELYYHGFHYNTVEPRYDDP